MEIRTYFWHDRIIGKPKLLIRRIANKSPSRYFAVGNAGDIFVNELIKKKYNLSSHNASSEGNRLLLVGSVANQIKDGDILCGIGAKGPLKENKKFDCKIYGLRGPITYDIFKKAGYDLSDLKFLLDPGLLITEFVRDEVATPKDIIFIPHYRERFNYNRSNLPRGMKLVSIDNTPEKVAKSILNSKIVYSSSLHGIIWAHALKRPCIFVSPQTEEPILKYEDYYLSVGLKLQKPLGSISEANYFNDKDNLADISFNKENFYFPSLDELKERDVIR